MAFLSMRWDEDSVVNFSPGVLITFATLILLSSPTRAFSPCHDEHLAVPVRLDRESLKDRVSKVY